MHDIKGENWELTAGLRARFGRVLLFDPTNADSAAYNPLLEVRKGEWEVRDVQNVADVLVDPEGSLEKRNHWEKTSHSLLVGATVVANAAAAELQAVADEIVLLGAYVARVSLQQMCVLFEVPGERIVGRVPALPFFVPFKQRKLVDPAIGELTRISQAEASTELVAQRR